MNLSDPDKNPHEGHRDRLRARFSLSPEDLSETEILELLLTYAIPRKDVEPLANYLAKRYGTIANLLSAPVEELQAVPGLGKSSVQFLKLIQSIMKKPQDDQQPSLFQEMQPDPLPQSHKPMAERSMRVFTNEEIATSLNLLPRVTEFSTFEQFKGFLETNLPYNSEETRRRRANNILDRFYPQIRLDTPLTAFLQNTSNEEFLKPVIFYHVLKAEPIAAKVADELIYPALPLGRVDREQMREFILKQLPTASVSSQKTMLHAIYSTYGFLGIGSINGDILRFQLRQGNLASFLYILTCEFSLPGIYSFETLFQGPTHHWLLWDKEWIRRQLYNLRDLEILSKVSEIDSARQFSLDMDQESALSRYFELAKHSPLRLRERDNEIPPSTSE